MAGKSKFQILRNLDERINKLTTCNEECDQEFAQTDRAYLLGFHYSNVTNYIGLTADFKLHNASGPVVGLVYFKSSPELQQIAQDLQPVREHFYSSPDGFGSQAKTDKNEHLFLIYSRDEDSSGKVSKRVYDANANCFLEPQPKLSMLDETKIYAHSAMCKVKMCLKLRILEAANKLQSNDKIEEEVNRVKEILRSNKGVSLQLISSNFSSKTPLDNKNQLESVYASLDIPKDVDQMGDYLPNATKEDKKKLQDKWRNKVKDQRAPLEFLIEQEELSVSHQDELPVEYCKVDLIQDFMYLQANDTISKCTKLMLFALNLKLELIKRALLSRADDNSFDSDEIKSCTFRPQCLGHLLQAVYLIPSKSVPDFEKLKETRHELHRAYMIPYDRPSVRYSQRVTNFELKNSDEQSGYLCNVHLDVLDKSGIKGGVKSVLEGTYTYHHYLQDRIQDNGWGCAYRSLQTIISWYKHQAYIYSPDIEPRAPKQTGEDKTSSLRAQLHKEARVPTHQEIQRVLVDVGDKPASFVGSEKWIGSQEVCYVLNHLYNLDSKFISVSSGSELVYKARDLGQHFVTQSTPIMVGGGVLAHTIIGIDFNEKNGDVSYLILDPHYTGSEDLSTITKKGWCGWKKNAFWDKSSFYNLCLPQRSPEI
uniref:Ufm1-specific protease 2 n=1 Tax=Aceria tosichella TaxID=561515 RepID=A0A6G1SJC2_9ACAR